MYGLTDALGEVEAELRTTEKERDLCREALSTLLTAVQKHVVLRRKDLRVAVVKATSALLNTTAKQNDQDQDTAVSDGLDWSDED